MALKRKDKPIGLVKDNISPSALRQMPKHVKNGGGRNSPLIGDNEIGRASCRERVCQYV